MSRDFNGTTQYASRSDTCSVSDYPATFCLWVRPDDVTTFQVAAGLFDVTNNRRQILIIFSSTARWGNQADEEAVPSNSISTGSWFHIACISTSATDRTCVLNGDWANRGTNTVSVPWLTADEWMMLAADYSGGNLFNGQIAHAAWWNTNLSQAQVEGLAAGDNPLAVQATNLVAYWPLAGTTSPEPDDKNSYDLTLTGSPPQGGSDPTVDGPPGGADLYAFQ